MNLVIFDDKKIAQNIIKLQLAQVSLPNFGQKLSFIDSFNGIFFKTSDVLDEHKNLTSLCYQNSYDTGFRTCAVRGFFSIVFMKRRNLLGPVLFLGATTLTITATHSCCRECHCNAQCPGTYFVLRLKPGLLFQMPRRDRLGPEQS